MMGKHQIILVGGGGHCKSCIEVIEAEERFTIAGIVDVKEKVHQALLGYEIIACDNDLPRVVQEYRYFLITLGHIEQADKRKEKFEYLKKLGVTFPIIISPLAYVSKYASIGEGTIVMHKAFINTHAQIGNNCIMNSGAVIEHDVRIGDHCHISTGSVVNGACEIDTGTFVGSNSVIVNNIRIAAHTLIGAGAVVVYSIEESGVYVGNPVRRIR